MTLAARIKQRMAAKGDNIMDASKRTGIAYATMHAIVEGDSQNPKRQTLEKIARAYGVTIDWLLYGDDGSRGTFEQGVEYVIRALRETLDRIESELRSRPTSTAEDADGLVDRIEDTERDLPPDEEDGEDRGEKRA